MVLRDGTWSELNGKIWSTGSMRGDEKTKGREATVSTPQDRGQRQPPSHHVLGTSDLPSQLGSQPSDDATNTPAIAAARVGMGQAQPGIGEGRGQRLRRDKQLGIKRDVGILLVNLPENRRGRGPDPGRGTSPIPLTAP